MASALTVFSKSGPQQLPPVPKPEKIPDRKKFLSNEKIIAETEAYLETKNESFYKKGVQMLDQICH